jgi:mannose-6-phosphate isomerase-like protein (cupin superfamily)
VPKIIEDSRAFRADRPWDALDLAEIEGATVRLHWSDQPYDWHVNDGAEAFVVLDGLVDMHYREEGTEKVSRLRPGSVFVAQEGDEHVARPRGEARILVVERKGSI